ncbi:hybrid sensor histidine kinase/response regulator [Arenibaculum pallidiluteum]|uniref:hybrid sensor histidine kinase/response regulator n=1 Tax=Arenibaculum pallidiluteum TaxID=2812559 RepID=UPI001A96181D|nr:PAS domain-containing sensor histidine kinase [Arenibaculum pallidiluteum]
MTGEMPKLGPVAFGLIDQLGLGVFLLDQDHCVLAWNTWMAEASGLPSEQVLGRTLWQVLPDLKQTRLFGAVEDALLTGASSFFSHSLNPDLLPPLQPDGQPLLLNVRVRPVDTAEGRFCLFQVDDQTGIVAREQLLRQRGDARYRAIVDTAPEAIVTTDLAGNIQWANSAVRRNFGYAPGDLVGRDIGMLLAPDASARWPRGPAAVNRKRGASLELTGRRQDGTLFDLEVSVGGWNTDRHQFLTGILRDVTARKRAESELRHLNATLETRIEERTAELRLEAAERRRAEEALLQSQKMEAVGQLTGGMAHDFNNLLQAIQACFQILGRKAKGVPDIEPLLDAGRQAVDRGASLVRQLLAFSRKQALRPETFDVRDRMLGMRGLLERAVRADIQLEIDISAGLWPVLADPVQFELAVLNLVVNARDAIASDGRIVVAARNRILDGFGAERLSGAFVEIRVTDTGSGMGPDTVRRAFEPFFTTKAVGKGTGLGLSQVYGFCQQSGGTATVESSMGAGSTVALILPRSSEVPGSEQTRASGSSEGLGARILFVEDDPVVAPVVKAALEEFGYFVVWVPTGDEALIRLKAGERVDLLFSDVVMPGHLSGVTLAREARILRPSLPVLLSTGYSEDLVSLKGFRILAKPYHVEDLAAAIEGELGRKA